MSPTAEIVSTDVSCKASVVVVAVQQWASPRRAKTPMSQAALPVLVWPHTGTEHVGHGIMHGLRGGCGKAVDAIDCTNVAFVVGTKDRKTSGDTVFQKGDSALGPSPEIQGKMTIDDKQDVLTDFLPVPTHRRALAAGTAARLYDSPSKASLTATLTEVAVPEKQVKTDAASSLSSQEQEALHS